jgi:transposase, IS30 family
LGLDVFFANPYHSWERGLNGHTNGLIRQFVPKGKSFNIKMEEEFQEYVELINHRPRKSLDYRTPCEIFYASIAALYFSFELADRGRLSMEGDRIALP